MLLTVAAIGLLAQGPQDMKDWVDRGYDPGRPSARAVSGTPEATPKAAWAAVARRVNEDRLVHLVEFASQRAAAVSAVWLPGFVRDGVVREWTGSELERHRPTVLDRDLLVRDHSFGQSYQAFLLLDEIEPETATRTDRLTHRLAGEERRFLLKCGGTVGWWGVLAMMVFWLDRLSRGYMTGRLYGLGAFLGIAAPIALVML